MSSRQSGSSSRCEDILDSVAHIPDPIVKGLPPFAHSITRKAVLVTILLAGCGENLDSVIWACQLEVQKGNAGKSAAAADERLRDIEACMQGRGYRLDVSKVACRNGSADSACYRSR